MGHYEKPVVMVDTDLSEGVFMASGGVSEGATDCWTVSARSVQNWNGAYNVFEVSCVHTKAVEHCSAAAAVKLIFNNAVSDAYAEGAGNYEVNTSGNVVEVKRMHHANGYFSGDNVTYKVFVKGLDEESTKAMNCDKAVFISCEYE